MYFKIVSDSSSNIYSINDERYTTVPMTIRSSQKEYVDNPSLDIRGMIDDLKALNEKTSTSCPNVNDYEEALADADHAIVVTISRNLSGSYNAARIAIDDLPDKKITLIDTLSAGPQYGLIIMKIKEYLDNEPDMKYEELAEKIIDYNQHCSLIFALESLNNLANNGRVSHLVAKACGVLGIRIVGRADSEGKFDTIAKVRGKIKTTKKILEEMLAKGYKGGKVRIDHCYNDEAANDLKEAILKVYPEADIAVNLTTGLCSYYAEEGGLMIGFEF